MSTIICNETMNQFSVENVKCYFVAKESLALYVSRVRREKGLSLTQVEAKSGRALSSSYVSRIENGYVSNPSASKLRALARGLGVNEDELFAVARGVAAPEEFRESRFWDLFEECQQIENKAHRQLVDEMLDGVIRAVRALPKKRPADSASPPEAVRRSK